jgi:hypothetical protein
MSNTTEVKLPEMTFTIDTNKNSYLDMLDLTPGDIEEYLVGKAVTKTLNLDSFLKDCETGKIPPKMFFNFVLMGYQDCLEFLNEIIRRAKDEQTH